MLFGCKQPFLWGGGGHRVTSQKTAAEETRQRPDGHTFLCKFWHFQMAVSCLLLGLFTPNFGILLSLVCTLRLCGLIVANPIIYRLVPSPSRFEIRQWKLWHSSENWGAFHYSMPKIPEISVGISNGKVRFGFFWPEYWGPPLVVVHLFQSQYFNWNTPFHSWQTGSLP